MVMKKKKPILKKSTILKLQGVVAGAYFRTLTCI